MRKTNYFTIANLKEAKAILLEERANAVYMYDLLEDAVLEYQNAEKNGTLTEEQDMAWSKAYSDMQEVKDRLETINYGIEQFNAIVKGMSELTVALNELATDGKDFLLEENTEAGIN